MNEAKVRELLEEIEWGGITSIYRCLICGCRRQTGHSKKCHLGQALALLDKPADKPCKTCGRNTGHDCPFCYEGDGETGII